MSAFNDYCIVCEKLCSSQSAYCSDGCKLRDNDSHFDFNNAPQLISPALQPRADSLASALSSTSTIETDDEESQHKQEYFLKSPMLLSSSAKEQPITGLNLNEFVPRESLDEHHAQLLAASSNNYKKWLNVVL